MPADFLYRLLQEKIVIVKLNTSPLVSFNIKNFLTQSPQMTTLYLQCGDFGHPGLV